MPKYKLIQVTSYRFCAGIVTKDDIIVRFAPILRWTELCKLSQVYEYGKYKGWKFKSVEEWEE